MVNMVIPIILLVTVGILVLNCNRYKVNRKIICTKKLNLENKIKRDLVIFNFYILIVTAKKQEINNKSVLVEKN